MELDVEMLLNLYSSILYDRLHEENGYGPDL